MQFNPWVTLQQALEAILKPSEVNTMQDVGRVFAHEPKAPPGDWHIAATPKAPNPARAYVIKRIAESAGVGIRTAQRYVTYATQVRGITPKRMALLQSAATRSQVNTTLDRLSAQGAAVDLRATIHIEESSGHIDERHRTVKGVVILPDGDLPVMDQVWERFVHAWRIGDHADGAEWFQTAWFINLPLRSGYGELFDMEMLALLQIAAEAAA